ncbi:MAG: VanZ family protein [Odoribacteraceae bacterium]|jgi:VanZ family protein|nr:VanZ family protein [Odoribacteraceae bacterium]
MTKRNAFLALVILWATVIFTLCAIPSSSFPSTRVAIPHADKIVHFFMFLVMSVLLHGELRSRARLRRAWACVITILACVAYGGLIEVLQDRYFQRGGEWLDLLADAVGAVIGTLTSVATRRKIR